MTDVQQRCPWRFNDIVHRSFHCTIHHHDLEVRVWGNHKPWRSFHMRISVFQHIALPNPHSIIKTTPL